MSRRIHLNIHISNGSGMPIYEQITSQIKSKIISRELIEGEALPSMRLLAKELRISVITTKRAYEDLERDGFIQSVPGKGSYVAGPDMDLIREEQLRNIEGHLSQAVDAAKSAGLTPDDLTEMMNILFKGEDQ
jgi:GntR family transcriptional regulator